MIASGDEVVERLRRLHREVGGPPYRTVQRFGGPAPATASEVFSGRRPPTAEFARRWTEACSAFARAQGREVPGDVGPAGRSRRSPVLERDAQLREIDGLLRDAAAGSGDLVVVNGRAGVGKSTLLRIVAGRARSRGFLVLTARGTDVEQDIAFGVVRQLFARWIGDLPPLDRSRLLAGLGDPVVGVLGAGSPGGAPADPHSVLEALHSAVERIARRHRSVLLVDDAQWADVQTARWLDHAVNRLHGLPVLVVLARRSAEPSATPLVEDLVSRAEVARVELPELSHEAVSTLVRAAHGQDVPDAVCRACGTATGGNPFLLEELLRQVELTGGPLDAALAASGPDLVSDRLHGWIRARVRRFGNAAVRFASAVAVLGPCRIDEAAHAAELPVAGAWEQLDRLVRGEVLTAGPPIDVLHPLIGHALRGGTDPSRRDELRRRAARWGDERGEDADTTAAHLLATMPTDDPWVVDVLRRAAVRALAVGAPELAGRYLVRAAAEPPPPSLRARVEYECGVALVPERPTEAARHLDRARRLTDDAALRTSAVVAGAKALAHADRMAEAVRLLERAEATTADVELRRRLGAERLLWASFWTDHPDAGGRTRELAELAGGRGDSVANRTLLALRAWDMVLRGEPRTASSAVVAGVVAEGVTWLDPDLGFDIPTIVGFVALFGDDLDTAEALFDRARAELDGAGRRGTHLAFILAHVANVALRRGRLLDAEADAEAALRMAQRVGPDVPAAWYALGTLLQTLLARGAVTRATELAREHAYFDQHPNAFIVPLPAAVCGELELARGRRTEAARWLRAAGRWLDRRGVVNPSFCPWTLHLARAVRASEHAEAVGLAERALVAGRRCGSDRTTGHAHRLLAALGAGDPPELLEGAVDLLGRASDRVGRAAALLELGHVRWEREQRPAAVAAAREGLALADGCGADGLGRAARHLLARAGAADVPPPPRLAVLSARQLRASRLAADGATPDELARALVLDRAEVTALLDRAAAALGVSSVRHLTAAVAPGD